MFGHWTQATNVVFSVDERVRLVDKRLVNCTLSAENLAPVAAAVLSAVPAVPVPAVSGIAIAPTAPVVHRGTGVSLP